MTNTNIELLPTIEQVANKKPLEMKEYQTIRSQNPSIYFNGEFGKYGYMSALLYKRENIYNIMEDEKYRDDLIIEFDNHELESLDVMWGVRQKQFDTPEETIDYLKTLKILPIGDTTNTYQKFLDEIDIETFESLSYPVAVDMIINSNIDDKPYVTLFIATNTFPEGTDLTYIVPIMSEKFTEKFFTMVTDYKFYKDNIMYDIYVEQEHPENESLHIVYAKTNENIFLDDDPSYHDSDIAQYIEENVLGVTYDKHEVNTLKLCTEKSVIDLENT